jgi:hypothetical protein
VGRCVDLGMKKLSLIGLLILFAMFQWQCGYQVLNINLEPIDDWKTDIYYHQGTPIAISRLDNSILTTYVVKTPESRYQIFISARNLSDKEMIISHEDINVLFNTSIGPIESETLDPNVILSKKIRADNLETALTAMNAALVQVSITSGTVGDNQVNITTKQSGLNPANLQMIDQQVVNSTASANSLKNSLLFKNTIFPDKKIDGLCYIKPFPSSITTPKGVYSTEKVKIESISVNIRVGTDFHSLTYKMPQS